MSSNGPVRNNLAAAKLPLDTSATTSNYAGPVTGSVVQPDVWDQDISSLPIDQARVQTGTIAAEPDLEWDDVFDRNDLAFTHDDFRTLIAGTRNPYNLREWSKLDPLDRSFHNSLRYSAASSLARAAKAHLKEDHPLLPDVVDAACRLFENGVAYNSRIDRMQAAEIIVSAAPYMQIGFKPARRAAVVLREFIEAKVIRHKDSKEEKPYITVFSEAVSKKPFPPRITAEFIRTMKRRSLELAKRRVATATDEILACMQAYGTLIPTFKAGQTEVIAGMLMCGAVIDDSSNTDLMTKAFELRGELSDIQSSGPVVPRSPLTYV